MSKISMRKGENDKSIEETYEDFMSYNKAKNLSKATLSFYERKVKRFINAIETDNIYEISWKEVEKYKINLQNKLKSSTSVNTHLRAVRCFLNYCTKFEDMQEIKVELVKTNKKIKETYTDKELEILLEKPDLKKCTFSTYRTWVIINYLLATGNRSRTVRFIKIKDIDFENNLIQLSITKNRKQQIIPMTNTLSKILQEYLTYRKEEKDGWLFPTNYGKQLARSGLSSAIRRYNKKRGITKTSIHLFRHTFAKKWILQGGDIFRLQKLLGHSSMDMVKEYVSMFTDDLKKDLDKFNPLEQMAKQKNEINMK